MAVKKSKARISDVNLGGSGTAAEAREKFGIQYYQTVSWNLEQIASEEIFSKGDPCKAEGTLGEINTNLQKLFVVLRGVQKYGDFYINGAINKVQNLKNTISAVTSAIAGVLKTLVQRLRNWVLNKLKKLIIDALEMIMTNFLKSIKESIVAAIIDQIFCAFEKIIKSLFGLVGDFLYSLIGQIIQTPFCAAEQWTNAMINKLVSDIDKALEPIFEQINDILGGVGKIFGSVSSAIDTILGFQGFLCGGPECPEIKEFALSPWGGPTKTQTDSFSNFNFGISPNFAGEITDTANGWLNDFFGPESNSSQSPGSCYTGNFECGLPQVVIFGGGGAGAVAQAVVNNVGQVIGTNLLNPGQDYKTTPFVQIVDPAGCGSNASAFAVMKVDENGYETGEIEKIKIENPGSDYDNTFTGGAPVITSFYGAPNPISVNSSVSLSWNVVNADEVSLGISGLTKLGLSGSASVPITDDDVSFGPGETETTKTFTLTAIKKNKDSSDQTIQKTFILTVVKEKVESSTTLNTNSPEIISFTASSTNLTPGSVLTLSWETKNAKTVSMSNVDNASSLPKTGSLSVVIPSDIEFPSDGSGAKLSYKLTAKNDDATEKNDDGTITKTVTKTIKVTVTKNEVATDGNTLGSGGGDGVDDADEEDSTSTSTSTTTTDTGDSDQSSNDSVSTIDDVDIIDTGIGYSDGDTVSIDDGDGGEFEIEVNQLGQIVGFNILQTGYGYTSIPNITINSETGVGAKFRANLNFTPLNRFLEIEKLQVIDPNKLVKVIDCIGNTVPSQSINT